MYALAPGYNNAAGFVNITTLLIDNRHIAHVSSVGTYQAARELLGLDRITREDGLDKFNWSFEWLRVTELDSLRTTFLGGAISGPVTVETRNSGTWVQRNAILKISRAQPLRGEDRYGPVTFEFIGAKALP
jgi:hypothetical protein